MPKLLGPLVNRSPQIHCFLKASVHWNLFLPTSEVSGAIEWSLRFKVQLGSEQLSHGFERRLQAAHFKVVDIDRQKEFG